LEGDEEGLISNLKGKLKGGRYQEEKKIGKRARKKIGKRRSELKRREKGG